jgi:drug/metabolite transporter (DMT)-like permease
VFLAVLPERFFAFRLGRWQWFGVTITAAGLAVIGLTGGGAARPQRSSLAALIAFEAAIFAVGALLVARPGREPHPPQLLPVVAPSKAAASTGRRPPSSTQRSMSRRARAAARASLMTATAIIG